MQLATYSTYKPAAPLLIWDGQCGFCKYWVTRLKLLTGNSVLYIPYQQIHDDIKEIPQKAFKKAIRMIGTDGKIYSGAGAAYKTLEQTSKWRFLISWYGKSSLFKSISDFVYRFVSNHRPSLFILTKALFGKNPTKLQHYWILYVAILLIIVTWILNILPS